jgi:hypothetical protein
LSKEFSEVRLGEQTQKDKGNEKKYLKKFYELHEKGKFLKYFMDKDMASKFLNNAKTRMTALKTFDDSILKNPIKLQAHKTNQGWSLTATTIDAITELFYRFEGDDKFTSTGFLDFLDQRTGKTMPSPMINAPPDLGKIKIFFKYKALGGEEQGPFEVVFDPGSALRDSMISMLKQTPGSWATYRFRSMAVFGKPDIDYFHLRPISGCGVDKVMYAWDDDKNLDKEFPIFECDPDNPHAQPRDYKNYLKAPPGIKFLAVQVYFKDGTKSKVRITKKSFKQADKKKEEARKQEEARKKSLNPEHAERERIRELLKSKELSGANLKGADLEMVKLNGKNLQGANLQGANLIGTQLKRANLQWANLKGADLTMAKLQGANLQGADLQGVNLSVSPSALKGTNLTEADLTDAHGFFKSVFKSAILCKTKMPSGKVENRDCK